MASALLAMKRRYRLWGTGSKPARAGRSGDVVRVELLEAVRAQPMAEGDVSASLDVVLDVLPSAAGVSDALAARADREQSPQGADLSLLALAFRSILELPRFGGQVRACVLVDTPVLRFILDRRSTFKAV
jgi:hypothetical protein